MGHFEKHDLKAKSVISFHQMEEIIITNFNDGAFSVPIYRGPKRLSDTGLLIPNISYHKLKAELAGNLRQWLKQIYALFNWRIKFILVIPGCFQWG